MCISNRAKRMFIHLNRLYIGRDIELYALVPYSYLLLLQKRPFRGLRVKRLYIGAYGTFKFKWSYIFRYVLYALVPYSYLLQLKRRPVLVLTLKRLYIGAYGTFKFKWSYIYRYVWIDNFHGYRLVSSKVWRRCYAAVWRTIYSSKFAYFGKYIDAYLYAYETIASKLYTRLH